MLLGIYNQKHQFVRRPSSQYTSAWYGQTEIMKGGVLYDSKSDRIRSAS